MNLKYQQSAFWPDYDVQPGSQKFSIGGSLAYVKTTQGYGSGYSITATEKGLNVLDLALWLNCYYFSLPDFISAFSYFSD